VSFFAEQFLPDLSYDKDFPAISSFRVQFIVKPQWSYRRILANDEGVPRNFQRNIFFLGVLYQMMEIERPEFKIPNIPYMILKY